MTTTEARTSIVVAALAIAACSHSRELFPWPTEESSSIPADSGGDRAQGAPLTWGEYAATLDVPACTASRVLVVNTTADEMDAESSALTDPSQAGPTLSLVEALWIAANEGQATAIYFSEDLFPTAAPATIRLGRHRVPLSGLDGLCIDARNRGVILDWEGEGGPAFIWPLRAGALEVGLSLLHLPFEQEIQNSQIAGCRFGWDGSTMQMSRRPWEVEAFTGATVGPANVFGGMIGIRIVNGTDARVVDSFFGWDPLARRSITLDIGVSFLASAGAHLTGNVFGTQRAALDLSPFENATLTLQHNRFGVDFDGTRIPIGGDGIGRFFGGGAAIVGPGNVLRGAPTILSVGSKANVRITQNSLSASDQGIVFETVLVPPPTITSALSSEARGTCAVDGTVELFSDPAGQGELYLGSVACDASTPWRLAISVPSGRNVTAILTDTSARSSGFSAPFRVP